QQRARSPRDRGESKRTSKRSASRSEDKGRRPNGARLPEFVPPSLATLQEVAPSGRGWVHEIKFDGYRIQARLDHGKVRLLERKAATAQLLGRGKGGAVTYSEHFEDEGPAVLRHACQMGLEGIVSKRADAPYRSGRSDSFIKTKCSNAQELVVGGYSPSTVLPRAIGALAVGYYDDGRLVYAGRVGTGYTRALARDLWRRLHPLERTSPPFDQIPRAEASRRDIRWVEPKTVIEANL